MKKNVIIIRDCKENILDDELWKSSDDYSLFHITSVRTLSNKDVFDNCSFFDLFINHKTDWGAPIPSTFQHFFEGILQLIIPKDYILIFNIVDLYEGYFEQDQFIEDFLKPNNYLHFFLNKEVDGKLYPTIFFECPIHQVSILDDIAFSGTTIDVDGFVLKGSKVSLFQVWHKMGNTDTMFRDLLRNVYFAFGIWADHNGMFVATDKFDISKLQEKLFDSKLERDIYNYLNSSPEEQ